MTALLGRRTLGIQARLVILILSTVLPLVGLASATILRTVDDEQARIQRDVRERAENLLGDVGIAELANREFRRLRPPHARSTENSGDIDRLARHQGTAAA